MDCELHSPAGRYAGRRALILGGTHGMGRATAEMLSAEGADVLVTGRHGGDVALDLTDPAGLDGVEAAVRARLGALDLLHVNAGYAKLEPFAAVTEASFDRTFAVNVRGAFFAVQRLAPLIAEGGPSSSRPRGRSGRHAGDARLRRGQGGGAIAGGRVRR